MNHARCSGILGRAERAADVLAVVDARVQMLEAVSDAPFEVGLGMKSRTALRLLEFWK